MIELTEGEALAARTQLAEGCHRMKELLNGLLDSKGRVAEEVHAIRKLGKSLRGGFTLFRLDKSAALEIQAIGRLLAGPRDAVSRQNTWNKLEWNADPSLAAAIAGLLEIHVHSAARRPPQETVAWACARVDAAIAGLDSLPPTELAQRIAGGLDKLEKRVIKRCHRLDHRAEEDFHEARKSLKAWLGAVGFLPEGTLNCHPLLHEMAEFLGDENDLATLSAWLDEHGFTKRFAPDLRKSMHSARRKLQKRAIRDATQLAKSGRIGHPPETAPPQAPEGPAS
jgi:CHAD domain